MSSSQSTRKSTSGQLFLSATDNADGSVTINSTVTTPVFGTQYQYAESLGNQTTTSTTFLQKVNLTTTSLPAGTYRIGFMAELGNNSVSNFVEVRCQLNNITDIGFSVIEPKDGANYYSFSGFSSQVLSGINTIDIDFRANTNTAKIRNARIEIFRTS